MTQVPDQGAIRGRSLFSSVRDSFRLLMEDNFAVVGVAILAIFILLAIIGPWLAPYEPFKAMMTETRTAQPPVAAQRNPSARHHRLRQRCAQPVPARASAWR